MQQRARNFRNYVDFATAARYIVEMWQTGNYGGKYISITTGLLCANANGQRSYRPKVLQGTLR
eukprot:10659538-Karenia_brevis.AAC.1